MATNYRLCKYPANGFGNKNGLSYLMNEFGEKFEFKNEYDRVLDERFWTIELPVYGIQNGDTINEIVEKLKLMGLVIKKW